MKKSELKTGMIVEFKDGRSGMVLLGTHKGDVLSGDLAYFPLSDHEENLMDWNDEVVVRSVYNPTYISGFYKQQKDFIIWERPQEIKEYTMEELTEKLGHNFKIKK